MKLSTRNYADNLPVNPKKVTWKQFKKMVKNHDLTYSFSDDHRYWIAGESSMRTIREAARNFPTEKVRKVWNKMVDSQIVPKSRQIFYWREEAMMDDINRAEQRQRGEDAKFSRKK